MDPMGGGEGPFLSGRGTTNSSRSQGERRLLFSIVPFFSKGNARETKGNFGSWFPRQRSLFMVGCFQLALVSDQSEVVFFFFQISEQKELMLALKINSLLL